MTTEIEAKWVDVKHDVLRAVLRVAGAEMVRPEGKNQRTVFDLGPRSFARVREGAGLVTMTYKQFESNDINGMKEIDIDISDYEKGVEMLKAFGMKAKSEQETLREVWYLGAVEVALDTWPWLPPIVELEGPSEVEVEEAAAKLGLSMSEALYGSVDVVYAKYYDVTRAEVNQWPEIKFGDGNVPEWLAFRRRV
ncbi:CYTH domain-containing protein [Candidatus Saccharibacteria bacterium]|nr:CYTH domain-containing protein [Candidatus Saccharibacteria bacterium]